MSENAGMRQFTLSQKWWALALRGLSALIFGILALTWPGITVAVLGIFFGVFVLVSGIFSLVAAVSPIVRGERVLLLLLGVLGIVVGAISLSWPEVTALVLFSLIAVWALVAGILDIVAAFRQKGRGSEKWLLGLTGVLAVILGVLLLSFPIAGVLAVILIIGIFAILIAISLFALAFIVRSKQKRA